MKSFEFCVPTDILFGVGQEARLPAKLSAYGNKILLTYGGWQHHRLLQSHCRRGLL